jgi:PAB-dependent poly(A)-specific ribonuclease subunit 3
VDSVDCRNYVIRRFDNIKTSVPVVQQVLQQWGPLKHHPSMVPLCNIIYDKQNPSAIYFLYEYFPLSKTLSEYYVSGAHGSAPGGGGGRTGLNPNSAPFGSASQALGLGTGGGKSGQGSYVQESVLWDLLVQMIVGMRSVHMEFNSAIRAVDTHHILVTSLPSSSRAYAQAQAQGNSPASTSGTSPRIRFNCVGVLDVLDNESRKTVQVLQQEDVFKLAQVIVTVGLKINSASISKAMLLEQHFPHFQQVYSAQLCQLMGAVLGQEICHIDALSSHELVVPYLYSEVSNAFAHTDSMYNCLSREYENGRLLRILIKLGVLNERPSATGTGGQGDDWSETGDRYILKLFRDYVFHQCYPEPGAKSGTDGDSSGVPCVDIGHIVSSLHKLDVNSRDVSEYEAEESARAGHALNNGVNETILLTSRNNKDMVIVSYKDVAR